MRLALSVVTRRSILIVTGSIGFLFTNYAFTDWLDPRGDLGEFAAMMLVPWLIYWCLKLVKSEEVSLLFIPVVFLLENTHSAIALVSVFSIGVALALFLAFNGKAGLLRVWRRLVLVGSATIALLLPLLIAQYRFFSVYDPQTKNVSQFTIQTDFVDPWHYLYDGSHRWYAADQLPPLHNFVQIDFAIWIPLVAFALIFAGSALLLSRQNKDRTLEDHVTLDPRPRVLWFLVVCLALYLFLQLRVSYFVYRLLPPLQVINFPWRMLAFITPLSVVLLGVIADHLMSRHPSRWLWPVLCLGWLGALIATSPVVATVPTFYEVHFGAGYRVTKQPLAPPGQFPSINVFKAPQSIDNRTFHGFVIVPPYGIGPLYNVFLPKATDSHGHEIDDLYPYAVLNKNEPFGGSLTHIPCKIVGATNAFETLQLTFRVSCAAPTELALPVSINPSSSVFVVTKSGMRQIPYFRQKTDPRVIVRVTTDKPELIVVHLPTLWGTLF